MSSILKALEKVEDSSGILRVAGESRIIRSRNLRTLWGLSVAVGVGAAVAAMVTFAAMGGFVPKAQVVKPSAIVTKSPSPAVASIKAVPEVRVGGAPLSPAERSHFAAKFFSPSPKPPHLHSVHAKVSLPSIAAILPLSVARTQRPDIKVTGIAWQNNGKSIFAIVNGRVVLQGETVDGIKVLEIHKDSVKFFDSNGSFDVPWIGSEQ